ncbi:hypothetical protein MC885_021789 [Smutsia gigantea]|nr:hypothetical protein MC885_021789 [Smutsia gigantea]
MNMGGLWPWLLAFLSLPGLVLGAPSASGCSGACGTSFSEDLPAEETQTSWDKDIPAINQGLIPEETPESSFLLEGDILRPSPFRLLSATSNKWPKNGGVVEVPFLLSSKYEPFYQKPFGSWEPPELEGYILEVLVGKDISGLSDPFWDNVPEDSDYPEPQSQALLGTQLFSANTVLLPFLDIPLWENKSSREVILEGFAEFERSTCIRFVAYQGQRDFISIIPMSGCFSSVGRSGGMQVVSLSPTCLQRGPGIVLHELMHVLGFWHEHARADRDRYIRINWNEILPGIFSGFEINFIKSRSSNMLVPYDYSSVMHYGRLAFSRRGLPTIIPLWAPSVHIGQRWNLSTLDITRVLRLYDCSPSGLDPRGRGFQPPSNGRSLTPDSTPYLQRLLKALTVESSSLDTADQHVAAGPGESPRAWEAPALRKSGVEAPERLPQPPASSPSSRPGASAPGIAVEQSRLARAPAGPPTPSLEDQAAPNWAALENPDLPGAPGSHLRGMPRLQACGFCPRVGRASSAQSSWVE